MKTTQIRISEHDGDVTVTEKPLQVAEWFAFKKFQEKGHTKSFDNHIFAIIGESEKAYNCILGTAFNSVCTWVPKSLVEEEEIIETNLDTYVTDGFAKAKAIIDDIRKYWN